MDGREIKSSGKERSDVGGSGGQGAELRISVVGEKNQREAKKSRIVRWRVDTSVYLKACVQCSEIFFEILVPSIPRVAVYLSLSHSCIS